MDLRDCQLGRLVQEFYSDREPEKRMGRIGHVVGLALNHSDNPETIPVVRFATRQWPGERVVSFGEPEMIHHSNLVAL